MSPISWRPDGLGGRIEEDGKLIGIRLVQDWYEPRQNEPRTAWVVEWLAGGFDATQCALLELDGQPVSDEQRIAGLAAKANAAIEQGPPDEPPAFGFGTTGLSTNAEIRELIKLTSHALQCAEDRLHSAADQKDEYIAMRLNVAVVDVAAWLRTLDDLLGKLWRGHISLPQREAVSRQVDQFLDSPGARPGLVAEARTARAANGEPYDDWNIALLARPQYIPSDELRGFRWLAGKLLHHGPLSTVELRQWRAGAQPRWKWRSADAIFPRAMHERQETQRTVYEKHLSRRDVLGSLNLGMVLIETENLFLPLLP